MQINELIINHKDQAKALQDVGFLGQFVNPASPSDVAKKMGMAANLAHHYAQKHAGLGLLLEAGRENGKVYYQLAAKTFKHSRKLTASPDPETHFGLDLSLLMRQFLNAYERSDRHLRTDESDWTIYSFVLRGDTVSTLDPSDTQVLEVHPAHFQARTVRLSQTQYLEVVKQIRTILETTEAATTSSAKDTCTLAFLAFDGELLKGVQEGQSVSSFVPPAK